MLDESGNDARVIAAPIGSSFAIQRERRTILVIEAVPRMSCARRCVADAAASSPQGAYQRSTHFIASRRGRKT
jgi:hypothetical protein